MSKKNETFTFDKVIPTDDPKVTLLVPMDKCPEHLKNPGDDEKFVIKKEWFNSKLYGVKFR